METTSATSLQLCSPTVFGACENAALFKIGLTDMHVKWGISFKNTHQAPSVFCALDSINLCTVVRISSVYEELNRVSDQGVSGRM
jgi:hypothetical protein